MGRPVAYYESKTMKTADEMTLEELAEAHAGYALSNLLTKGGEGLRSSIWAAMSSAIQWRRNRDKAEAEATAKAKATYQEFCKATSRLKRTVDAQLYTSVNENRINLTIKKDPDLDLTSARMSRQTDPLILGWLHTAIPSLGTLLKLKENQIVYQGTEGTLPVTIRFQPNARK